MYHFGVWFGVALFHFLIWLLKCDRSERFPCQCANKQYNIKYVILFWVPYSPLGAPTDILFASSGLRFDSKIMSPPIMVVFWVPHRLQVAAASIPNAYKHNNINYVTLFSPPVAQSGPAAGHLCPSSGSALDP